MKHVIAILCSDLHLSLTPPIYRSAEPDWLEAQRIQLNQLREAANKHTVPIICAGDVFDKWKSPPELINFALEHLPDMYAIPGQHDLPLHNYEDMDKSAYGTLVRAGKIKNLKGHTPLAALDIIGFPWGFPITPPPGKGKRVLLAVVHAYCWMGSKAYAGAKQEDKVGNLHLKLKEYNAVLFGDNHKPFLTKLGKTTIFNHGGFQILKSDDTHHPAIGLLHDDGNIETKQLNTTNNKYIAKKEAALVEEAGFKMKEFLAELDKLGASKIDFVEAVHSYFKSYEVSSGARKIILEAIDHDRS